jgi:hypothetical protein
MEDLFRMDAAKNPKRHCLSDMTASFVLHFPSFPLQYLLALLLLTKEFKVDADCPSDFLGY